MPFALADCNNFYVSCERAFNPALRDMPVVVLSNNDGCVISRSPEAKAIGITMGLPLFKAKELIRKNDVAVFSSNYALYGHMSRRVMDVMTTFPVEREVYSIDEAFLKLPDKPEAELFEMCRQMRQRILQWTGIPVSIGIAETKTLAKLANNLVKRSAASEGVVSILDPMECNAALETFPVGDVWGVGRKIRKALEAAGITTAAELRDADTFWMRRQFSIKGLALVLELRGQVCNEINSLQGDRREIIVSRSFGQRLSTYEELAPAFTEFARRGAERLAAAGMSAKTLTTYVVMDRYRPDYQGGSSVELEFDVATGNAENLAHFAREGLREILTPGRDYKKGGIILGKLSPAHVIQESLFSEVPEPAARKAIAKAVATINEKHESKVQTAALVDQTGWQQKQEYISPRYTTQWSDLPVAR